jgi:hypothetical protein
LLGEPCLTVGLDCSCSMLTMAAKLFTVGNSGNHGNQVGMDCICTKKGKAVSLHAICICTMVTKLFALGNYGKYVNEVVYFRAETT